MDVIKSVYVAFFLRAGQTQYTRRGFCKKAEARTLPFKSYKQLNTCSIHQPGTKPWSDPRQGNHRQITQMKRMVYEWKTDGPKDCHGYFLWTAERMHIGSRFPHTHTHTHTHTHLGSSDDRVLANEAKGERLLQLQWWDACFLVPSSKHSTATQLHSLGTTGHVARCSRSRLSVSTPVGFNIPQLSLFMTSIKSTT